MADLSIKQNDTYPVLRATLTDDIGPVDLTTADSVKLLMKHSTGTPLVAGTCVVISPQSGQNIGKVTYDWISADTAVVGNYTAEFEVTWNVGDIETYPNAGWKEIEIVDDLG